jgi:hypothetical protein
MHLGRRAWGVGLASLSMIFVSGSLAAFDLAGVVPEEAFAGAGDRPSLVVELLNDTTAFGPDRIEFDDIRSNGIQAYGSWRRFALGLEYEGFTFRGDPPEEPTRDDELVATAAWMSEPIDGRAFCATFGGGFGLRAWGDFGFDRVQSVWHGMIEDSRPLPKEYGPSYRLPFGYLSSRARIFPTGPVSAELSLRLLAVAPGGIESVIGFLMFQESRASSNWFGVRRQGRFGAFSGVDELVNVYEAGSWLIIGSRTGSLSFENSMNAGTRYSLGTLSLNVRSGEERSGTQVTGPRQELSLGSSVLASFFSVSRFAILSSRPELRVGIDARIGVSNTELEDIGASVYQEGCLAAELIIGDKACPRPFAGLACGLRQDRWAISDLQRSTALAHSTCGVGRAYLGLRCFELVSPREPRVRISLDFGYGMEVVSLSSIDPEVISFVRLCVADPLL